MIPDYFCEERFPNDTPEYLMLAWARRLNAPATLADLLTVRNQILAAMLAASPPPPEGIAPPVGLGNQGLSSVATSPSEIASRGIDQADREPLGGELLQALFNEERPPNPWDDSPTLWTDFDEGQQAIYERVAARFLALSTGDLRGALILAINTIGDLRKGFAKSVDPARWVEQLEAPLKAAINKAERK